MSKYTKYKEWCNGESFSRLCLDIGLIMIPIVGGMFGLVWYLGKIGVLVR